jgi:hypothetical protein
MPSGQPSPVIAEARKQFKRCAESEEPQRTRIVAAKKFHALEQWPAAIKLQREGAGSITGQSPQPPRPCLVVDRLSQPMRRVSNTIKNADFGFDVQPVGGGADIETAEIYKGYLRRVQNQARGESPIEWAADQAIEGGLGWARIRTEYVHKNWTGDVNDPAIFDQELVMERIANNLTVYCDPSANRPTRSDAQVMFVTEDMDRDAFTRKYPKADLDGLDEFTATGDDKGGWISDDRSTIRVAEYWRITYTNRDFYWLKDDAGTIGEGTPPAGVPVRMTRVMAVPVVKGSKINAVEELEKWDWEGSRIPLIPVIGEELNVDGKPVLRGIIEPAMDAQRMVNYTYSGAIEIYALAAKKAPMIAAASVDSYKSIWQSRTIVNHSYLPYDPWDATGRALPPPTLDTTDAPIQSSVALMQVSEEAIKATTSTGDASLGNTNPNERSGRALEALQTESDLANSNYPDNVRRAYIYAATLMLEIIPKITRPGQILHILGMNDEPRQVMVGQPFKPGANGVPEPAPEGITPEMAKLEASLYKFYDLNNGTYHVTVTMGKASATRRKEGAEALGQIIPHLPPEMQAKIIPDWIKQLDFTGAQAIAEKLAPTDGNIDPAAAAAQLQQVQQENTELKQAIEGDTVKAKAALDKAGIDADVKIRIAEMQAESKAADNETKLAVAELGAKFDRLALFFEERARLGVQGHEVGMTALQQQHAREMGEQGHAQALEQGAVTAETQGAQAEAEREHQSEMQAEAQRAAAQQQAGDKQ